MSVMLALGLMSGTSMDGIDLALLETDGGDVARRVPEVSLSRPFTALERDCLREAVSAARLVDADRSQWPEALFRAEALVTQAHADVVCEAQAKFPDTMSRVSVIGFHGQTVLHRPQDGLSIQLGDGGQLAAATGLPVVCDFRSEDLRNGGEGAPFAPVYHRALSKRVPGWPVAFLNLGGVANVTWCARNGDMKAFDTGPGNALLDDWVSAHTNQAYDDEGRLALSGEADLGVLHKFMTQDFFHAAPPKSLDRNAFDASDLASLSAADGAATLTAFTCKAVAAARSWFPEVPGVWIVCGGGRKNHALMTGLAAELEGLVVPAEAVGLDGDMLEAEAFAYLAVRSMRGLPLSFPETTGVSQPVTGGVSFSSGFPN